MIDDQRGFELHDRSTRGQRLTESEKAELTEWYAQMDAAEAAEFDYKFADVAPAEIQMQIDATLSKLTVLTGRIQELSAENETIRQEISRLQNQLAVTQPV